MRTPKCRRWNFQSCASTSWRGLQALLTLSLLISLFTAFTPFASAQDGQSQAPITAPFQVALSGSFQTLVGCSTDFDPSCSQTQLQDNRDGSWSAEFSIPPGDYTFRVVTSSDAGISSLGVGGDPNGGDLSVHVPGGAAGVYFHYDVLTGEIMADPVEQIVVLTTDLGEQYAMAPSQDGGYQVRWDAQPGDYGFEILVNDEPASEDSISLEESQRVAIEVDESGTVTTKETLRDTTVEVTVVDADGALRPGSCFGIFDSENRLRTQACDSDDVQTDGLVHLRVPDGLPEDNYTLRETFAAVGDSPAPDQRLGLGPGHFEARAASAGEPATESPPEETPSEPQLDETAPPTAAPQVAPEETPVVETPQVEPVETPQPVSSLVVIAEDDSGNLQPEACYTVEIASGERSVGPFCDDDGDGVVTIQNLPTGPIRVVESTPPIDMSAADPSQQDITITAGERAEIVFSRGPLAEEPEEELTGSVEIRVVDAADQPVSACVDVFNQTSDVIACDNEPEDLDARPGYFRFDPIMPGSYTVELFDLPNGIAEPEPQVIDVRAGENTAVEFIVSGSQQSGSVQVRITDLAGEAVDACVDIFNETTHAIACDNDDDDLDERPGYVLLDPILPGTYMLELFDLPEEFALPSRRSIEVQPGETITVDFTVAFNPGTLVIFVEDETGEPLGGSCFTVESDAQTLTDICDSDNDGQLPIADLPAGIYIIIQTRAAENRQVAPEQEVTVAPGQVIDVTLQNLPESQSETLTPVTSETATPDLEETPTPEPIPSPTAPADQPVETGDVLFIALDDGGNAIAGQCFALEGTAGMFGSFCDDSESDASDEPGVLIVEGVPVGIYEAILEPSLDAPGEGDRQSLPRRSVTVRPGVLPTRVVFNVRTRGSLLIRVRDQDGNYLAGTCFGLTEEGQASPPEEVCDNDSGDENTATGRILISGLVAGRHTLTQTRAPSGYVVAADQVVEITAGAVREVAIPNQVDPDQTASLDVETVDRQGNLLGGACYALSTGTTTTESCDADGDDGVTQFTELEPGNYIVRQIQPPIGEFSAAGDVSTRIEPGQSAIVTVVNDLLPGSLRVRKIDEAGQFLTGACFALRRENRAVYSVCDNDASDADRTSGVILLRTLTAGDYMLRETRSPVGYRPAADRGITILANRRTQETVIDVPVPRPERSGDLRVFKIDARGQALAGSCFALLDGDDRVIAVSCDADDGADNGIVSIVGVSPESYTLRETRRPSVDFEVAPDVTVRIMENRTVDVEVENRLRRGRILIRKVNPNGGPLAGACFDLIEDAADESCTDTNGELFFADLAPGIYRIVETRAPSGYDTVPPLEAVTVRPGRTSTIDLTNLPLPPAPDSGSIQVRKFVCPAGSGGADIVFVDSSDPVSGLARTAGCDPGDASFTLEGPSDSIRFRTGAGGHYQTTLPAGDYVLTEISTGATENVSVSVSTLTTVVVLNFVEPAGEQQAAIDIVKYTCEPGFPGRIWLDFAEGCLTTENLTNNVAFRLSGAVSARRVTGDNGSGGATRFDRLPAGDYRLREEAPQGIAAVYAFCGLDARSPDGRSVGDVVTLRLGAGATVTCHWFNVPEDLTGPTGAVTITKFTCPITVPPANFDWHDRCDPEREEVRFSLSRVWPSPVHRILELVRARMAGRPFVPVIAAATDSDGMVQLTEVQPGIYDLEEVDAAWCRAESDSVDALGRVIVEVGQRATIWIFNCVGVKDPPNTGAGPLESAPTDLKSAWAFDWSSRSVSLR